MMEKIPVMSMTFLSGWKNFQPLAGFTPPLDPLGSCPNPVYGPTLHEEASHLSSLIAVALFCCQSQ